MLPPPRIPGARRLEVAFQLFELGVEMKRAQLAAAHPRASAVTIDHMVKRWLVDRPLPDNGLVAPRTISSTARLRARPRGSSRKASRSRSSAASR
jgi:hypothetical protein